MKTQLESVVDEFLDFIEENEIFDIAGGCWDEGDGYIATDYPEQSTELKILLNRLKTLRESERLL